MPAFSTLIRSLVLLVVLVGAVCATPTTPGAPVVQDARTYEFFPLAEKFYTPKAALTTAACMGIIGGIIGFLFLLFIIMVFMCNKKAAQQPHPQPTAQLHHHAGEQHNLMMVPGGFSGPSAYDVPKVAPHEVMMATPSFQALTGPAPVVAVNQTPFHSRADTPAESPTHLQAAHLNAHHAAFDAHVANAHGGGYGQSGVHSAGYYMAPLPQFPNAN